MLKEIINLVETVRCSLARFSDSTSEYCSLVINKDDVLWQKKAHRNYPIVSISYE